MSTSDLCTLVARYYHQTQKMVTQQASDSHLDLDHAPYNLYGVKYVDLVALMTHHTAAEATQPAHNSSTFAPPFCFVG